MRIISFSLLHALGCLQLASAEHTADRAVFHYRLCWFNPLVWLGYVLSFGLSLPYNIYRMWLGFTKKFNRLSFTTQEWVTKRWCPRIGEQYFYPAYDGKKFVVHTATYRNMPIDADRWENEYIYRSMYECRDRCQQFNTILIYGKK